MPKKEEAKAILSAIGMPAAQLSDMCCYTLLSLCGVAEDSSWSDAKNEWMRIHDIMQFMAASYSILPEHMIHMDGDRFLGPR